MVSRVYGSVIIRSSLNLPGPGSHCSFLRPVECPGRLSSLILGLIHQRRIAESISHTVFFSRCAPRVTGRVCTMLHLQLVRPVLYLQDLHGKISRRERLEVVRESAIDGLLVL